MKKRPSGMTKITVLALVLTAFSMLWTQTTVLSAEEPVVLDIATFVPPGQASMIEFREFFKQLEDATKGMVKARFHYSGAMGKPVDHYELALKGTADITHICIPYLPGTFPSFDIFSLPVHIPRANSAEIMTTAILELQKLGYFDKDFSNVKLIALESITPFQIQMAKHSLQKTSDIKGKKLRVTGLYLPKLFQVLGATTVFTPVSEVYLALQKGVAEGIVVPWPAQVDFKLYEVTKYVSQFDTSYAPYALLMHRPKWEKLPESAKKFMTENASKLSMKCAARWEQFDRDSIDIFQKSGGQIVQFDKNEWQNMATAWAPIWNEWIESAEKKQFPAKKQAKDLHEILKRLGVEDPFVGYKP